MCIPNLEFQLVNPTTQVALFSTCLGSCSSLMNITWHIYQGLDGALKTVQWTPFNQTAQYENIWFFGRCITQFLIIISLLMNAGRNTTNFTATHQLFLANPHVRYWRFEVVFSFATETSSSALQFVVNQPPSNGSCSISPLQGTTSTIFTVLCPDWFDEDGLKDYALIGYTTDSNEQTMLAFSSVSDFTVRLPSSNLNLLVTIRDTHDCVTSINLSSVVVIVDVSSVNQFVDALTSSSNVISTNPLARLLSSGNQNTVAQLITSLSQHFNQIDGQNVAEALSSTGHTSPSLWKKLSPIFRWCIVRQHLCVVAGKCHLLTGSLLTTKRDIQFSLPLTECHHHECHSAGRVHSQAERVCRCP